MESNASCVLCKKFLVPYDKTRTVKVDVSPIGAEQKGDKITFHRRTRYVEVHQSCWESAGRDDRTRDATVKAAWALSREEERAAQAIDARLRYRWYNAFATKYITPAELLAGVLVAVGFFGAVYVIARLLAPAHVP